MPEILNYFLNRQLYQETEYKAFLLSKYIFQCNCMLLSFTKHCLTNCILIIWKYKMQQILLMDQFRRFSIGKQQRKSHILWYEDFIYNRLSSISKSQIHLQKQIYNYKKQFNSQLIYLQLQLISVFYEQSGIRQSYTYIPQNSKFVLQKRELHEAHVQFLEPANTFGNIILNQHKYKLISKPNIVQIIVLSSMFLQILNNITSLSCLKTSLLRDQQMIQNLMYQLLIKSIQLSQDQDYLMANQFLEIPSLPKDKLFCQDYDNQIMKKYF
ncbi:unnamed protein product [Paramecium sonneborni]|uniref:Uncharacterized protein n=1 Tax=Paramecium sonneborni TaxID=65129 RepID=A0A8S1RLV2_9CILI|nr:unnamed protein product [Paramecium sonneborni]